VNSFKHSIKQTIFSVSHINNEEPTLLQIIDNLKLTPDQKLLDVGCGYGFKLKLLQKFNFKTIGVEVNAEIVKVNRASGLSCVSVEEFAAQKEQYDVMLMSHIIEHFNPKDLLKFVNFYLDRLKPGGYLIIITPLFTERFYNDFDHIKPYYPTGLRMVFGQEGEQVQYYSPKKKIK
jgi:2-polyprenyl-3-methyl-5-hydroxy-6-metoxy-1,4-benzoquinol methylase